MLKVRKGQNIKNTNGHTYKVLATKTNWLGKQNLLLKDNKTDYVIHAKSWFPEGKSSYGTWYHGTYYGVISPFKLRKIQNNFKKGNI